MGIFLILIVLVMILGVLVKHAGPAKELAETGLVSMASTDLLALLLQLTKVCEQLEMLRQESQSDANRNKLRKLQELLDVERKRLVGRLREIGVSELAIQQASSVG